MVFARFTRLPLALLVVVSLMGVLLVGCGSTPTPTDPPAPQPSVTPPPTPEDTSEDDTEDSEEAADLRVDQWQNPTNIQSIAATFSALEWRFASMEDGVATDEMRVSYVLEGQESIDGVEADKITLVIDDDEHTLWIDDSGNVLRFLVNGDEVDESIMPMMSRATLTMATIPFSWVQAANVRSVLRGTVPGFTYTEISRGTERFGDLSAEVVVIRVKAEPPAVAQGQDFEVEWSVADFGDLQMLVKWSALEGASSDYSFIMQIERLELRP